MTRTGRRGAGRTIRGHFHDSATSSAGGADGRGGARRLRHPGGADGGADRRDVGELEWFDHEQHAADVVEHDDDTHDDDTHDHGAGDDGGESPPSSG